MKSSDISKIRQRYGQFGQSIKPEPRMAIPKDRETVEEFIARGGKVVIVPVAEVDYLAECKKTGFGNKPIISYIPFGG